MVDLELLQFRELLFLLALSNSYTLPYPNKEYQEPEGGKEARMKERISLALLKHIGVSRFNNSPWGR